MLETGAADPCFAAPVLRVCIVQTETVSATEGRLARPRTIRARVAVRGVAERWSLLLAFVVAFVFFSAARPHTFLTWDNARAILDDSSVGCVLAVGVTAILVIGEFDLSVGFVAGDYGGSRHRRRGV